jgi:hypothetical protein
MVGRKMNEKILTLCNLIHKSFLNENFSSEKFLLRLEKIRKICSDNKFEFDELGNELTEEFREFYNQNIESKFYLNAVFLYLIEDYIISGNDKNIINKVKKFVYQM